MYISKSSVDAFIQYVTCIQYTYKYRKLPILIWTLRQNEFPPPVLVCTRRTAHVIVRKTRLPGPRHAHAIGSNGRPRCVKFLNGQCTDLLCSFAHGLEEIRPVLGRFDAGASAQKSLNVQAVMEPGRLQPLPPSTVLAAGITGAAVDPGRSSADCQRLVGMRDATTSDGSTQVWQRTLNAKRASEGMGTASGSSSRHCAKELPAHRWLPRSQCLIAWPKRPQGAPTRSPRQFGTGWHLRQGLRVEMSANEFARTSRQRGAMHVHPIRDWTARHESVEVVFVMFRLGCTWINGSYRPFRTAGKHLTFIGRPLE